MERRHALPTTRHTRREENTAVQQQRARLRVGLLTGADDKSYALGLSASLVARGIHVDFVGSDQVDGPELHGTPLVRFLNLRGDQSPAASPAAKARRLFAYYLRLMAYAVSAEPRLFHILWNNKFEWFDRTLLMVYYRLLGRRVVFTAHNVNAARRDGRDNALNRLSLRIQYRLASHVFVHTARMQQELRTDFRLPDGKISVIPFGINNTTPTTPMTAAEARARLDLGVDDKVMLFFGQIAPYKGLEYLIEAMARMRGSCPGVRLVIAGKVKQGHDAYWEKIEHGIEAHGLGAQITLRKGHIPDGEVEIYFKASDVLVIPYVHIFQSGVPFLAYSFGLPVIATDVGSLRDDVLEGRTGLISRPRDASDLARTIGQYFEGDMYRQRATLRPMIQAHANERHSWSKVAAITESAYRRALGDDRAAGFGVTDA